MHRHPDRHGWIVADEMATTGGMPTGDQIVFRYDAVTAVRDYNDGTLMVWTNTAHGFYIKGTVEELFNTATEPKIPPLPMGDGGSVSSDVIEHLTRLEAEHRP